MRRATRKRSWPFSSPTVWACWEATTGDSTNFQKRSPLFTRGRTIEESEKLEVPSSYNLVNAITLPFEMDRQTSLQHENALKRAIAAIQRQVKLEERRNDRWAWADLGECQVAARRP